MVTIVKWLHLHSFEVTRFELRGENVYLRFIFQNFLFIKNNCYTKLFPIRDMSHSFYHSIKDLEKAFR